MTRTSVAAMVIAAAALGWGLRGSAAAPGQEGLTGTWTLNRSLSQIPREVGFGMDLLSTAGSDSGGRGGAGSGGSQAMVSFHESADDAKRREQLTDEVTSPSSRLTIAQAEAGVTMTDQRGRSRVFHPDGKEETQTLDQVPVVTTTRWDGSRLEVRYQVERNRELRYSYSRTLDPPRLTVQVRFVERGGHDVVTFVYEPTRADEPPLPDRATPPGVPQATPAAASATTRASGPVRAAIPSLPADPPSPAPPPGPGAEFRGLKTLGVVVEDLSPQAAACGLTRAPIEAAVSKILSDAGFKIVRDSDEDTYVYVHIMTTSTPAALCVSRYDTFLYTHTTATLPYQSTPVLVQVSLLHEGGISGGAPGAHADAVVRNVKQHVEGFVTRIHAAAR